MNKIGQSPFGLTSSEYFVGGPADRATLSTSLTNGVWPWIPRHQEWSKFLKIVTSY